MNINPPSANIGVRTDALSMFLIVGVRITSVGSGWNFYYIISVLSAAGSISSNVWPIPLNQYYIIPNDVVRNKITKSKPFQKISYTFLPNIVS